MNLGDFTKLSDLDSLQKRYRKPFRINWYLLGFVFVFLPERERERREFD